jgi:hypothetical protein
MQPASVMAENAVQAFFLLIIVSDERSSSKTYHASVMHSPCTRNLILNDCIALVNLKTDPRIFFIMSIFFPDMQE